MTEKSRAEFILEVIKTFLWPALIVAGVIWLGDDLKQILNTRQVKIGGIIEVGDKVSNLQSTLQDELLVQKDFLTKIVSNAADAGKVKQVANEALSNIENAEKGVNKEIKNIQQTIPQAASQEPAHPTGEPAPRAANGKTPNTAKGWEALGFDELVARDADSAIAAFSEAEKIWPDYHNVAEIRQLLVRDREKLGAKNDANWKALYQKVLGEFSWGMPAEARQKMRKSMQAQ